MKLHAGRLLDLADLDILLKEAGVAAEADLYLSKRYGRRPDRDTGPTR